MHQNVDIGQEPDNESKTSQLVSHLSLFWDSGSEYAEDISVK